LAISYGHHGNLHPYPPQQQDPMPLTMYKLQTMGYRSQAHKMFIMFSIIAGLTGVNNIFSQLLALTYPGNLHSDVVLRIYAIGFFFLVVLIESERIPAIRESFVVNNWICRGIFYSFLGALGQNLYDVGYDNRFNHHGSYYNGSGDRSGDYYGYYGPRMPSSEDFAEWYIWLTSFLMFSVGWIYIIMGALCLQWKLQQIREQYQQSQFATAANRAGVLSVCACID
jgi:hypothetical protein